jgi:hypothetical protein
MSVKFSRRTFLGGMLAIGAAMLGLRWWQERRPSEFHVAALLELLEHHHAAVMLGQRYREAVPRDDGIKPLVAALAATFGAAIHVSADDPVVLRRIVGEQIRRDFQSGQVVDVDGWLLSETEARLCALVSVEPSVNAV